MNRLPKFLILGALAFAAGNYLTNTYLAPIEKRVDTLAKAAEEAGLNEEPADVEKLCGVMTETSTPQEVEKINACYQVELKKQIGKLNKVLKAGDLPTLGRDEPCSPGPFEMTSDDGAGQKLIQALYEKKPEEAHALLSRDMRAKVSAAELTGYVDNLLWRGKTIAGATSLGSGSTSGGYVCEGKTIIPVASYDFTINDEVAARASIESIQEDGAWRVRAIKPVTGSRTKDVKDAPLPEPKRLSELVSGAMHAFIVDSYASKIDLLYYQTSMYLRGQESRAGVEKKFAPFFGKYEFLAIEGKKPVLTSEPTAVAMDRGWPVFEVKGEQPTTKDPISFKMKFAYDGVWELADLTVVTR